MCFHNHKEMLAPHAIDVAGLVVRIPSHYALTKDPFNEGIYVSIKLPPVGQLVRGSGIGRPGPAEGGVGYGCLVVAGDSRLALLEVTEDPG